LCAQVLLQSVVLLSVLLYHLSVLLIKLAIQHDALLLLKMEQADLLEAKLEAQLEA
jgi:hypothetical protein